MRRTFAMIKQDGFEKPFVLDILKVVADGENQYDLPIHYLGHVMNMNFEYESPSSLSALGEQSGYQHLYLEGKGSPSSDSTQFSWMNHNRFYTLTSVTDASDELLLTRLGANDPHFNLRRDPSFIIRRNSVGNTVFATAIEAHGSYSPVSELGVNTRSSIAGLKVVYDDENYTAVSIEDLKGQTSLFILSNTDASASTEHELTIDGRSIEWSGPFHYAGL